MNWKYGSWILFLIVRIACNYQASAQGDNNTWKQKPETVKALITLSNSNLSNGKIFLMNSSHQDIAWMDSPEKCIIERDTMLLTPLYNRAITDPSYRFDVEDALMLKEYIRRHPDRKEGIGMLLKKGQLSCGSSYIQPYEEMYSGESLARQFYFGARWLKKEFGYQADTYWNPDVPGRTLQMPQLLSKAGTKYMLISRFEKGIYKWYSPDNSYVIAYSPGHYAESFTSLQKDFYGAADYLANSSMMWSKYFTATAKSAAIPVLSDWDMSPAKDYSNIIQQWNTIRSLPNPDGSLASVRLPAIELSLTPDFIKTFENNAGNIPSVKGERPAVWLYIHGPTHQKAIRASREGDILLTVAEKFATANAMIDGTYAGYPEKELSDAWEAKIFPDHGWGGKHGDITDHFFLEKYMFAKNEAEKIIGITLHEISSKIKTSPDKGLPVVVFNSLSWKRTDEASVTIGFDRSKAGNLALTDAKGAQIATQLTDARFYDDGSIQSVTLHFMASDVPSIGYKTYYLKTTRETPPQKELKQNGHFENRFYKIELSDGGLSSIFDKELNKDVVNPQKMKAGEVFTLHSEGTGAGEFADIQQPDMKGFDRAANYGANWKMTGDGAVFTCFLNRQPIRNAVVEEKITLYKEIKRIDFEVALLNYEGILYREYRMAMPVNMKDGQISYEVPFGMVNVGKDEINGAAGERYIKSCKDIHPRGIENFISVSNPEFGVTLSSSVAVADYIDPTGPPSDYQLLQPILIASRRSCHGEGNEYLQTGNHFFSFSLLSHKPGWENGFRFGRQANEKLMVVAAAESYKTADLPEELSFFSVENDNVVISAVKKAEEADAAAIRMYEISGKLSDVALKCFKPLKQAFHTSLIEYDVKPVTVLNGTFASKIGPYSIETFLAK
jgi:alpha-mannosidase